MKPMNTLLEPGSDILQVALTRPPRQQAAHFTSRLTRYLKSGLATILQLLDKVNFVESAIGQSPAPAVGCPKGCRAIALFTNNTPDKIKQ